MLSRRSKSRRTPQLSKLMPRMYGSAKKWDWGSEAATTADKEAFWAASEAAAGKWEF